MKKLAIVLMTVAAVACSETAKKKQTPAPGVGDPCTDQGATGCDGTTQVMVCDGQRWLAGRTCNNGRVCGDVGGGTFDCLLGTGSIQEGGACSATAECVSGLECIQVGADRYCLQPCDPAGTGTECGTNRYCEAISATDGICAPTPDHGEMCFNDSPCQDTTDSCVPHAANGTGTVFYGACTTECAVPDINTQGTCPAGELCLRNPSFYNTDHDDNAETDPLVCTDGGTECDAVGAGWECLEFSIGLRCGLNLSLCGTTVPVWDGTVGGDGAIPDSFVCGEGSALCGIPGATAQATCAGIFGPNTEPYGICVAICEEEGQPDLSCGAGHHCEANPGDAAVYYDIEEPTRTCTDDTGCTTATHPRCVDFGGVSSQCARPLKICQPD